MALTVVWMVPDRLLWLFQELLVFSHITYPVSGSFEGEHARDQRKMGRLFQADRKATALVILTRYAAEHL